MILKSKDFGTKFKKNIHKASYAFDFSARLKQFTKQRCINKQTVEIEICIHIIEIWCKSGMMV